MTHNDALQLQSSLVTFLMICISNLKLSYSRTEWYSQITVLQISTEIRQRLIWFLDWACYSVINRSGYSVFFFVCMCKCGISLESFWQQDEIHNHVQLQSFWGWRTKETNTFFFFLIKASFCHKKYHKGDLKGEWIS